MEVRKTGLKRRGSPIGILPWLCMADVCMLELLSRPCGCLAANHFKATDVGGALFASSSEVVKQRDMVRLGKIITGNTVHWIK